MRKFSKHSKDKLEQLVKQSTSIAQVLRLLDLSAKGGNYRTIKDYINHYKIDTNHFNGQLWSKGKVLGTVYPIEDYLTNKRYIGSCSLKERLLNEKFFDRKCYKCNLTTWNNQPIPIELEHIDGDHANNTLSNLTLLCPNCHAQTDTYRGKNQQRAKMVRAAGPAPARDQVSASFKDAVSTSSTKPGYKWSPPKKFCSTCSNSIYYTSTQCKRCVHKGKFHRIAWPSKDEILKELETKSYLQLGRELGVSDNAIRKFLKRN